MADIGILVEILDICRKHCYWLVYCV